jgi:hypothetical protein
MVQGHLIASLMCPCQGKIEMSCFLFYFWKEYVRKAEIHEKLKGVITMLKSALYT